MGKIFSKKQKKKSKALGCLVLEQHGTSQGHCELVLRGNDIPDIMTKLGVPKSTVYYQILKYKKTGMTEKLPQQGRKRTARNPANVTKIKAKFRRDPLKSMRQVAQELQIDEKQVRQVVKRT